MSRPSRRYFLNSSIGFAAAMSAGAAFAADNQTGGSKAEKAAAAKPTTQPVKKPRPKSSSPSERVNVAVIGCGGRGGSHIASCLDDADHINLVALCDPDETHVNKSAQKVEEESGEAPKTYTDIRKLLEDKSIDAVSIATPNHWHTLASIWAIQAGKDVYVEKPLSHNISEGRRLVEFARKHNKVVLHGTQSRSAPGLRQAMQFLHDGGLGKVFLARGLCYKGRPSIGLCGSDQPIPKDIDYNLWCGPASDAPPHRNSKKFGPIHYEWHWFWEYGNGDIGNQGVHQMDIAAWGLDLREAPTQVQCIGGRFGYKDDAQTPNTQVAVFQCPGGAELIFEVRGLPTTPLLPTMPKEGVCNIFYGTEGMMVCSASYGKVKVTAPDGSPIEMPSYDTGSGGNHFTQFVRAIKSRKLAYHAGECEAGHVSATMCHMANVSYRTGQVAPFNRKTGAFGDDKAAAATFLRLERHLAQNKVNLEETEYMVGSALTFDPKAERFTNNEDANKYLTRNYRAPFVVPDHVA